MAPAAAAVDVFGVEKGVARCESAVIAESVGSQQDDECPSNDDEERRVVRKIDMIVLPTMCLVFFMQYLDKQSLAYVSVYGLIEDLKLEPNQFSWLMSGFYLTQLIVEIPFIYIMSRLPLAKTIGVTVIAWGICCACLAIPSRFASFLVVRCLLGCAETIIAPAFITLISIWYKQDEHPLRIASYVSCNGLAQIVGSFMMYGIGQHAAHLPIAAWRVMFIVCGVITIVVGVVFLLVMPAGPDSAWFLTASEKIVAVKRMAAYQDVGDRTSFSSTQFREACFDLQTYHSFFFGALATMSAPVLTFATLVIRHLGYTPAETLLYGSPSGAVQIAFIWISILTCWLFKKRSLTIMLIGIVPLIGSILLFVLPASATWGVIVASWLASIGSSTTVIFMSLLASNVRGNTKKATVNAVFNIGYCLGFIVGPQLWTHPPRYQRGVITTIVSWVLIICVFIPWYWWLTATRNARRDKAQIQHGEALQLAHADATDKENLAFRYTT